MTAQEAEVGEDSLQEKTFSSVESMYLVNSNAPVVSWLSLSRLRDRTGR